MSTKPVLKDFSDKCNQCGKTFSPEQIDRSLVSPDSEEEVVIVCRECLETMLMNLPMGRA